MQVMFINSVRTAAGVDNLEITDELINDVQSLIKYLDERLGAGFTGLLLDDKGNFRSKEVVVLVDGRSITNMDGLDTSLSKDSVVAIFNPISGG